MLNEILQNIIFFISRPCGLNLSETFNIYEQMFPSDITGKSK